MTHPLLQCRVTQIDIDDQTGTVTLHLPRGNCTDYFGAIELANIVCPSVQTIRTVSGTRPDTSYLRTRDGWKAICARSDSA